MISEEGLDVVNDSWHLVSQWGLWPGDLSLSSFNPVKRGREGNAAACNLNNAIQEKLLLLLKKQNYLFHNFQLYWLFLRCPRKMQFP